MNRNLSDAIDRWKDEVDDEAASLISEGMDPETALMAAKSIVSSRRRSAAMLAARKEGE